MRGGVPVALVAVAFEYAEVLLADADVAGFVALVDGVHQLYYILILLNGKVLDGSIL